MSELELVVVTKDGREMKCNPNGVSELAKFGWKLKGTAEEATKKAAEEAAKKAAEEAAKKAAEEAAEAAKKAAEEAALFESLVAQCKEKGIKVTAADTSESLTKKLSA